MTRDDREALIKRVRAADDGSEGIVDALALSDVCEALDVDLDAALEALRDVLACADHHGECPWPDHACSCGCQRACANAEALLARGWER